MNVSRMTSGTKSASKKLQSSMTSTIHHRVAFYEMRGKMFDLCFGLLIAIVWIVALTDAALN